MIVDQLFLHSLLRSRIFIRKNPSTHTSFFSNTYGVGVFTSSRMSLFCARASRAGLYFQQELEGIITRKWNSERFIVFRHVSKAKDIKDCILRRLKHWKEGKHKMLIEYAFLYEQCKSQHHSKREN